MLSGSVLLPCCPHRGADVRRVFYILDRDVGSKTTYFVEIVLARINLAHCL